MSRDLSIYLQDILDATDRIQVYVEGMDFERFVTNMLVIDGVVRNLEVIGEAVKHLPDDFKSQHPDVEWSKISGLRDILIHAYFNVDNEILWEIVQDKLPELKVRVKELLATI